MSSEDGLDLLAMRKSPEAARVAGKRRSQWEPWSGTATRTRMAASPLVMFPQMDPSGRRHEELIASPVASMDTLTRMVSRGSTPTPPGCHARWAERRALTCRLWMAGSQIATTITLTP
jgi:hypothetical protein